MFGLLEGSYLLMQVASSLILCDSPKTIQSVYADFRSMSAWLLFGFSEIVGTAMPAAHLLRQSSKHQVMKICSCGVVVQL